MGIECQNKRLGFLEYSEKRDLDCAAHEPQESACQIPNFCFYNFLLYK